MVSYVAGEKIALAGVPTEGIRLIVKNYLQANYKNIGATEENFNAAQAIRTRVKGNTITEQMMHVEDMRAEELKGKKGPEADKINKSYDLALAYYGMYSELRTAQNAGGDEAYSLPSLPSRLAMPRIDEIDGRTLSPAGKWRAKIQDGLEARKKEKRAAELSGMAPIYAAIAEQPESERAELKRVLESAHKKAKENGVTGSDNLLANMRQSLNSENTTFNWLTDGSADAALKVIARAQEIAKERGTEDIFLSGTALKQQREAAAKAQASVLFGTQNIHYGDSLSIAPDQARQTATVAILSAGFGKDGKARFDANRVNEILAAVDMREITGPYTNAELRYLHDAKNQATDQNEKNALTAVIGILTLENKFAEDRAAGKNSFKMFASNKYVVNYYNAAATRAAGFASDDATVSAAPGAGGSQAGGDSTARTGFRKVYGRKDGTPPPPEDEVPTFTDEEQVKELQRSLGVEVDGMYGPETHAAMKAKAAQQNKQPKEFDFTLEGIFSAFIQWLTGGSAGAGQTAQPAAGIDASVLATAKTLMEGKTEDALDFRTKAANGVMDGVSDKTILDSLPEKLAPYQLTPEEMSTLRVSNGILSSDLLKSAERLLGLDEDGKMDAKLQAALNDDTVRTALLAAVRGGAGSTDVAAPGSTPGGSGAAKAR